jgi:predicted thioesterase
MMNDLMIGLTATAETKAAPENSAQSVGSGSLEVFATPAMIALMEKAAAASVQPRLEHGQTTVGTLLNVSHVAATPLGMQVTAKAELVAMDNRKLTFKVEAFDEKEKIGEGIHERFIINIEKFMGRVNGKRKR